MESLFIVVMLVSSSSFANAHLCIISPHQRGPLDISKSGSPTCFRHGAPCGGQPEAAPIITYKGGQPIFIKWQQNYNHYEVGYPGYMDLAVASIDDLTKFTTLAVVQDSYVYSQDHQQNYTAVVVLPNVNCPHCVLRGRYVSHKPGEQIFFQCSDIQITASTFREENEIPSSISSDKNFIRVHWALTHIHKNQIRQSTAMGDMLYGFAFDPFMPEESHYVAVDPIAGTTNMISKLQFGIGSGLRPKPGRMPKIGVDADEPQFIMDAIAVTDASQNVTLVWYHDQGDYDNVATSILLVGTYNGSIVRQMPVTFVTSDKPVNALILEESTNYLTFQIMEDPMNPGKYFFQVGRLDINGAYTHLVTTAQSEDTYINYQWATYHPEQKLLYVLLGNENAADSLDARIYTFDISSSLVKKITQLDVRHYTFQSIHLYQKTGELLALSPGLFNATYPAWTLVKVDPILGNVTKLFQVTPPGIFSKYYGGTIVNGLKQEVGKLHHVLRLADSQADIIVHVDVETGEAGYSGLNNLRHIHNLALV